MAATLAGVCQVPLTAVLLLFELTQDYRIVLPLLGDVGLSALLPKLVHDPRTDDILTFLHEKLSKILSGDDTKAIQIIILSLGHLCVKESSSSIISDALDLIFSLGRSKVEDVLFAAGEDLSLLWGGVPVTTDMILKTDYSSLFKTSNYLTV